MADISLSCSICGTMQNVAASCAGQTIRCPVCNSPLKVPGALAPDAGPPPTMNSVSSSATPAPAAPAGGAPAPASAPQPAAAGATPGPTPVVAQVATSESARLRLTKDRTADGEGRKCPACEATMAADDVVCSQCGYNTKTGQSMADIAARRDAFRRALAAMGALLIVLAAGYGAWHFGWFEGRQNAPAAGPEPAAATNVEIAVASTNPPRPPPPPPPEAIEKVRAELKTVLDRNCPQAREGDRVNLELTTSRIVRGILRAGPEPGTILIEAGSNQVEKVQFKMLKMGSRLQCDPDYRAQELERQVQKRLML